MIIQCCDCKAILGEKEPIEDKRITHTYCPNCYNKALDDIKKIKQARAKPDKQN